METHGRLWVAPTAVVQPERETTRLPKVLLNPPNPENLPVVAACDECNQITSSDEEYVACAIEVATVGSTDLSKIRRDRIARILSDKPALRNMLNEARRGAAGRLHWGFEPTRVRIAIEKLARGHAVFDLNERYLEPPSSLGLTPRASMDETTRQSFESPPFGRRREAARFRDW